VPDSYSLLQNFPNPFNPSTMIEYQITKPMRVKLNVYDVQGRFMRELVNEEKSSGSYSVIWDGKDNSGNLVASGTYFYKIQSGEFIQVKKMTLLK